MSQVWIGGIYLKEEGGYEIILRSLSHYRKRLKSIGRSPELTNAPMFAQIVLQEASKTGPLIDPAMSKINDALGNPDVLADLKSDVSLYERALICYKSDIQKAQNGSDEFYSKLISDNVMAISDYPNIETALEKIKQFSS